MSREATEQVLGQPGTGVGDPGTRGKRLPGARVRSARWWRRPWTPATAVGVGAFLVYAVASIVRHETMRTAAYDLGIFYQAVAGYADFSSPVVHIKAEGFNLLGDHFHPILVVLAPLFWVSASPVTLLLAQAALFAAGVAVVTHTASRWLGRRDGILLGSAYALCGGIAAAVTFDFHEIAFAVPLLALVLAGLAERRYWAAALWSLPLLLVKEDLFLTTLAIAALLAFWRAWRPALVLAGASLLAPIVMFLVVFPSLSPTGGYIYFSKAGLGSAGDPGGGLLARIPDMFTSVDRWQGLVPLLIPVLFLAFYSPLVWVAVPTMAWRLLSSDDHYWSVKFHYSATVMTILFVAAADGLRRMRGRRGTGDGVVARWRPRFARWAPAGMLGVVLVMTPSFQLFQLVSGSAYDCTLCRDADRILPLVPDGATVAADNYLAPQIIDRTDTFLLAPDFVDVNGERLDVDYVLLDLQGGDWLDQVGFERRLSARLQEQGYEVLARSGRVQLLVRESLAAPLGNVRGTAE